MSDRALFKSQALDTLSIIGRGHYEVNGHKVHISELVDSAVQNTKTYVPDLTPSDCGSIEVETKYAIANVGTLEEARFLSVFLSPGQRVGVLNFASAKNPGGGFLRGANAQEEYLARSSALYACIKDSPMYFKNKTCGDLAYTNNMIFSPDVPVWSDGYGNLHKEPYTVSILTAPAVNMGEALKKEPGRKRELEEIMRNRIHRALSAFADEGCVNLVLGAWGCGVFRNDPQKIALWFHEALSGQFKGLFRHVRFAVIDKSPGKKIIQPFAYKFL